LQHVSPGDVASVIRNHHVLRRIRSGSNVETVESFRLADRVDVSRGWLAAGLDRGFLREVVAAFPYAGFHGVLVATAWRWVLKHPLRPLPMLRLSRAADDPS
jgi:hypothetical protein